MSSREVREIISYLNGLGEHGAAVFEEALLLPPERQTQYLARQCARFHELIGVGLYRVPPVDVKTFVESPYFMEGRTGGQDPETGEIRYKYRVWPEVMPYLVEANSGKYTEMVCAGGIGSAKTTLSIWTLLYQLHVLHCYKNPHAAFDLDAADEILIVFQSLNKMLAADVDYKRFRVRAEDSRYFRDVAKFDRDKTSVMEFDAHRIVCKPIIGSETGAIGQNVIGSSERTVLGEVRA